MSLINSKKILICMGSGGVGKTTVSASLSVAAANMGKSVLVLTIDPSLRLATALGLENWRGEETLVTGLNHSGKLYAAMINPKEMFDDFVKEAGAEDVDTKSILLNAFYKELSTSLSGTQEFTSLQALYKAYKSKKYDIIILDTPPAEHTLQFLESPQHIYNLFSGSVVEWFSQISARKSTIFNLVNKSTYMAFKVFEKITGSQFLKEMEVFFTLISKFRQHVKTVSGQVREILGSSETAFILVTRFDYNKLQETYRVSDAIRERGFFLEKIIMNGVWPIEIGESADQKTFYNRLESFNEFQKKKSASMQNHNVGLKTLPMVEYNEDETVILKKLSVEFENEF